MTEEEAKQELREYRYEKAVEQRKLEMLEELENDCMRMSSVLSDMPKSPTLNVKKMEEKLARYIDMKNEIIVILTQNMAKSLLVTKKIQSLDQPYRNIIELKYIEGCKLWEIQDILNCGRRTMDRLYKTAIEKYSKI